MAESLGAVYGDQSASTQGPALYALETKGGSRARSWGGASQAPTRADASSRLPVGGSFIRKFRRVLQAEMWLSWVLSCSVSGPVAGPASPPSAPRRGRLPGCLPLRAGSRVPARAPTAPARAALFWTLLPLVFLVSSGTKMWGLEQLCQFRCHSPSG